MLLNFHSKLNVTERAIRGISCNRYKLYWNNEEHKFYVILNGGSFYYPDASIFSTLGCKRIYRKEGIDLKGFLNPDLYKDWAVSKVSKVSQTKAIEIDSYWSKYKPGMYILLNI